jgi:prepilin-type N-terminal cleavage/methylation domain-containing protein
MHPLAAEALHGRRTPLRRRSRTGFTLVELLIVLGIIVLLVSILLPAINRAREEARRVQCLSNMRQLTMAWLTYANANKGRICGAESQASRGRGLENDDPNHWVYAGTTGQQFIEGLNAFAGIDPPPGFFSWSGFSVTNGVLWPYVISEGVYRCPDDSRYWCPTDYQINGLLAGRVGIPRTLLTLSEIRRPSSTFVFIEGLSSKGTKLTDKPALPAQFGDPNNFQTYIPFNSFVTPLYPATTFNTAGGIPGQNHQGAKGTTEGTGISFADGHAIFWQYADSRLGNLREHFTSLGTLDLRNYLTNSPDLLQLEAWSGGRIPPGAVP